jgi:hypothetical protein
MEHADILQILSTQLAGFLKVYEPVSGLKNPDTKIPTKLSAEVQKTFCQQLSSCCDSADAAILIQSDIIGAMSFASLAGYVLDFYSKYRNLATVSLDNNGRPFSLLAALVLRAIEEIERGAIRPQP